MNRFMGIMLIEEIVVERKYKDEDGHKTIIQAGPKGWSIIFSDYSTIYDDNDSTPGDNFKIAYAKMQEYLGSRNLTEVNDIPKGEMIDGCSERDS